MSLRTSRYVSGVACLIYISARNDGDVGVDFMNSCCLIKPGIECKILERVCLNELQGIPRKYRFFNDPNKRSLAGMDN